MGVMRLFLTTSARVVEGTNTTDRMYELNGSKKVAERSPCLYAYDHFCAHIRHPRLSKGDHGVYCSPGDSWSTN